MNIFSIFLFLDSLLKTNTFCKSDVYICEFYIFLNVGMGFEFFFYILRSNPSGTIRWNNVEI